MICFSCKGEMLPKTTIHAVQSGGCIIVVKDVPCSECSKCGMTTFNGTVALKLEKIVTDFEKSITEIAVANYSAM